MSWRGILLCVVGVVSFGPAAAAEEPGGRRAPLEGLLTAEPCHVQAKGEMESNAAFDHRRPGGGG